LAANSKRSIAGFGIVCDTAFGRTVLKRSLWEKKPERKRKNLICLGVPKGKAYAFSRMRKGGWAIAQSPILTTTITLERLGKRGYECMNDYYEKVSPMFNEPLYTRTVLPVSIKSGYSGVRASPCHVLHGGAGYLISSWAISIFVKLLALLYFMIVLFYRVTHIASVSLFFNKSFIDQL